MHSLSCHSGMANPGPIASVFWLDDALDSRLRLDGIVTICDAVNIAHQLETTEEAGQQIAYADRILLNKMDLVSQQDDSTVESLVRLVRKFHPMAPIRQTSHSAVPDLNWILDARCFDSDRFQLVDGMLQNLEQQSTDQHHHHEHSHDHGDDEASSCEVCQATADVATATQSSHKHTSGITSFAIVEKGTLDLQLLNRWLASALWPNQDATNQTLTALIHDDGKIAAHQSEQNDAQRIFRIKGVVSVCQYEASDTYDKAYITDGMVDKRRFILQSVHDLWDLYPASDDLQWQENEERTNKIVVIGKNLDESSLRKSFQDCVLA